MSVPSTADWRRNLFTVTAACFIGFAGFTLVMPFLPLYLQQLGLSDVGDIAFWSGISLGVTPGMTALLAPLWGRLSDRFGPKLMVNRSLVSFVIIMIATAYATQPWHIFALRVLQGFFAGYGALVLAMAAESAPPDRMASAIGMVQTAQRLGPALGPVIGGFLAASVGIRNAFFISAGFYALAFVLVFFGYREQKTPRDAKPPKGTARVSFRNVLAFENFVLLMGVIFGVQFVDRSLGPIVPLYVESLGVSHDRIALVSGLLFSVLAAAAAVGHHACGHLLRRWTPRAVISGGAAAAAVCMFVFAVFAHLAMLTLAAALFGFAVGVAMTASYATGGSVIPQSARATGFGFLTSASLAGLSLSPMISGLIAGRSIRLVFVIDAVLLTLVAIIVSRVMRDKTPLVESPPAAALAETRAKAAVVSEE